MFVIPGRRESKYTFKVTMSDPLYRGDDKFELLDLFGEVLRS